jgi:hypothetical protein
MRRIRSLCCARAVSGTAVETAMAAMKSRRRIVVLKAQDHANSVANYSRDLRPAKWGSGSVCTAAISGRSCPLWVISGHWDVSTAMSALPPKADMVQHDRDVRFVPKADSCSAAINAALGQVLSDFHQQLTWAKGLRNVIIAARFARLLLLPAKRIRRNRDNLD